MGCFRPSNLPLAQLQLLSLWCTILFHKNAQKKKDIVVAITPSESYFQHHRNKIRPNGSLFFGSPLATIQEGGITQNAIANSVNFVTSLVDRRPGLFDASLRGRFVLYNIFRIISIKRECRQLQRSLASLYVFTLIASIFKVNGLIAFGYYDHSPVYDFSFLFKLHTFYS